MSFLQGFQSMLTMTLYVILFCTVQMMLGAGLGVLAEPSVKAMAPVNPVQENGIFSLHCEVRNLRNGDEVTLLRSLNGDIERLSVDKDILPSVDERIFLSFKQMKDGSVIYFLSMADVTRHDEGQYSCRINNKATDSQVIVRSVNLNVMFFPEDSYPTCSSNKPLTVDEGTNVSFNCTSADAFPTVDLAWSRAGDGLHNTHTRTYGDGTVSRMLNFKVNRSHDKAVFICTVTSSAFPEKSQTCHIGPLSVRRDPKYNGHDTQTTFTPTRPFNGGKHLNDPISIFTGPRNTDKDCRKQCQSASSKSFFWIVSTVVAAAMAFAFFIIGLILFVKYYRLPTNARMDFSSSARQSSDKLYAELQCRQTARQIYMTTDKREEY